VWDLLGWLTYIVPTLTGLLATMASFVGAYGVLRSRRTHGGLSQEAEEIRERLSHARHDSASQQYALLREYHAQGLSQSRISFWFSLIFASVGFAVIATSVALFVQQQNSSGESWLSTAGKPVFTLIAGTIIDAVSALFFVQSNKARQLMTEFFDKLRTDRKLDESLKLVDAIPDVQVGSNLKALLAISFADIKIDRTIYESVLFGKTTGQTSHVAIDSTRDPSTAVTDGEGKPPLRAVGE
jgi:hypothetical protein